MSTPTLIISAISIGIVMAIALSISRKNKK